MQPSPFREAIETKDWNRLEEAWLELVDLDLPPAVVMINALEALLASEQKKRALGLVEMTLPALRESSRHGDALALTRVHASIEPESAEVRKAAIELAPLAHGDHPEIGTILDRAQREATEGALSLFEKLEMLLVFRPGHYVEDSKGWGMGKVREVDLRRMEILVDFESKRGHRIPIESAVEFLTVEDPERFECKLFGDRDALVEEAKERPADLIRRFLRSRGLPTPLRLIRQSVSGVLVPEKAWSKLWAAAKAELIHDPYLEISPGAQPTLTLREEARSREQEVARDLRNARNGAKVVKILRAYLAEPAGEGRAAYLHVLIEDLQQRIVDEEIPGARADLVHLLVDLASSAGALVERSRELAIELIDDPAAVPGLLADMQTREYAIQLVRTLAASKREGWELALARVLETDDVHPSAREAADRALKEGDENAVAARDAAYARMFNSQRPSAEPFFWASTRSFEGKIDLTHLPGCQPIEIVEKHLDLVGALGAQTTFGASAEMRALVRGARKAVTVELVRSIAEVCDPIGARRLSLAIARNNELDGSFKALARSAIIESHPEAAAALAEREQPDDVIWSSREGLKKRQLEYKHLITVEIKANGVALGKARELGDLSENAEWDAAREEERRLISKQKHMAEELGRAREVVVGSGVSERVEIGTRVTVLEEGTGASSTYTILGPWDVDTAGGIISYMSPLGAGLIGKKIGEPTLVTLPSGQTTVTVQAIEWATSIDDQ